MKTYHVQDRLININNLFINEENQYSSGDDVDLDILPTSTVEVELLINPSRSRSEWKNFFRYLVKSVSYNPEKFQVYSSEETEGLAKENQDGYDPETEADDVSAVNYPYFLFSLFKAGLDTKIVKQISQTMFKSGATVDFIRKTANAFNLYNSVQTSFRSSWK